jgi:hypothetical protein
MMGMLPHEESRLFQESDSRGEACSRFNALYWHDSKLLGLKIENMEGHQGYQVTLQLDLYTDGVPDGHIRRRTEIRFKECRMIQAEVDLLGMSYCGGDIATAFCQEGSERKALLESRLSKDFDLPQPDSPLADLNHYTIDMIHPGGLIHIFARGFLVNELSVQREG